MNLYKNKRPFGLMSEKKQKAMMECGGSWEVYRGVDGWRPVKCPSWCFYSVYRQAKPKQPTKPSVDWSVFTENVVCIAINKGGRCFAFTRKPELSILLGGWFSSGCYAYAVDHIASFKRGTCDWTDSLVYRPGYEPKGGDE